MPVIASIRGIRQIRAAFLWIGYKWFWRVFLVYSGFSNIFWHIEHKVQCIFAPCATFQKNTQKRHFWDLFQQFLVSCVTSFSLYSKWRLHRGSVQFRKSEKWHWERFREFGGGLVDSICSILICSIGPRPLSSWNKMFNHRFQYVPAYELSEPFSISFLTLFEVQ